MSGTTINTAPSSSIGDTHKDLLAAFAYRKAGTRMVEVKVSKKQDDDSSSKIENCMHYNIKGLIFHVAAVAATIFGFMIPGLFGVAAAGLTLGAICMLSDIRERFAFSSPCSNSNNNPQETPAAPAPVAEPN